MVSCRALVSLGKKLCLAVSFVERDTSLTTFQRSRASVPSMRNPASKEMISVSVELWNIDGCFLHIQLMETSLRLPKTHKTLPDLNFEFLRSPAKLES